MTNQSNQDDQARTALKDDGARALGQLFDEHRDRLRGMLAVRIDSRLKGRVDPSDVIQEAFVEAQDRLGDYLQDPKMTPFLWIRFLTMQRLMILHRHHIEAKQRDARREVSINRPAQAEASSINIASFIVDSQSTPSKAIQRAEQQLKLQQALEQMEELDREILALRHFEHLTNPEVAQVLEVSESAASQRYYRALKKLKDIMTELFGEDAN